MPLLHKCGICFESMDDALTHECTDCKATFCVVCMSSYIDSRVQEGLVDSQHLICPVFTCVRALTESLIEALATSWTFQKYKTILKHSFGIRYCPSAICSAPIDEPRHSRHRRAKCSSCQQESCMRCGGAFHKIPICRGMEKQLRNWKKQQRKNTRSCPNCKLLIEKNGGCQDMTCTHCWCQFCWICARPWKKHSRTWCNWKAFVA